MVRPAESDHSESPSGYEVNLEDNARAGIIGPHGHIDEFNLVTPRRKLSWPVVVGSPPPAATAFQPRTGVLEQIDHAKGAVVLRQVMAGNGGVGKSQIAAEAFRSSAAHVRVWVTADSRTAVVSGYADAALRLDLADRDVDAEVSALAFLGYLAATDRSWVVILDDLSDPADLTGLWPPHGGQLMVTTRRRDASLSGGGRTVIDVDVYTPEEAQHYMHERFATVPSGRLHPDVLDGVDELIEHLGRLPLALAHASAVVIDDGISCRQYSERFADRSRSLADLFPPGVDSDGYSRTIATTWNLAVEAADQLDPVGLARPMAILVSYLDPAGVPEAVLIGEAACSYLSEANPDTQVDSDNARKALRALDRLSLLDHQPGTGGPRAVRMHGLTGRAIRQSHNDAGAADRLVPVVAEALFEAWPAVENNPALSEALRANTQALTSHAPSALWDPTHGAAQVLFQAGQSLSNVGLISSAITYWIELVGLADTYLSARHPDALAARNNLAGAYEEAGDLGRAIPLYEQTLADSEGVLGPDHPQTLTCRNNLAGAYESAGDLRRAIPLYERTLADRERLIGPDHQQTLTSRNNLAYAYDSAGNHARAISLYEQNLKDSERILGPDHPDTLSARNNLAYTYESAGDLGRALPLHEKTLADRERVLGFHHPDTLASRNNLAHAYRASGDIARAIPMYEQNLADSVRVLGSDHPYSLASQNNLAFAYRASGDIARAIPMYEQNLADRERVLGPDHPLTLSSRNNLAAAYQASGKVAGALPMLEQNLADRQRILGPDHPDTLNSRNNLAVAYQSGGDLARAISMYEQNLADRQRILGLDHPDTLVSRENLANARKAIRTTDVGDPANGR